MSNKAPEELPLPWLKIYIFLTTCIVASLVVMAGVGVAIRALIQLFGG